MPDTAQDVFLDIAYPFSGLDLRHVFSEQDARSTIVGQNVRTFDPLAQRGRGGSRPGISKFLEEAAGEGVIQHLATIVTTDAEAVGWSFEGRDFGYTGVYGGIGFVTGIGGLGGEITVNGGGGYQETLSYNRPRYHLEVSSNRTTASFNATVTITAEHKDQDGATPIFTVEKRREVQLRTSPPGRDGDGEVQVTSGIANFSVGNDQEETVAYRAYDITKRKRSTNSVEVEYTPPSEAWDLSVDDATPALGTFANFTATVTPAAVRDFYVFRGGALEDLGTTDAGGVGTFSVLRGGGVPVTVVFHVEGILSAEVSNTISVTWS